MRPALSPSVRYHAADWAVWGVARDSLCLPVRSVLRVGVLRVDTPLPKSYLQCCRHHSLASNLPVSAQIWPQSWQCCPRLPVCQYTMCTQCMFGRLHCVTCWQAGTDRLRCGSEQDPGAVCSWSDAAPSGGDTPVWLLQLGVERSLLCTPVPQAGAWCVTAWEHAVRNPSARRRDGAR